MAPSSRIAVDAVGGEVVDRLPVMEATFGEEADDAHSLKLRARALYGQTQGFHLAAVLAPRLVTRFHAVQAPRLNEHAV